ncbi:MAG: twitching motility protein PilT [Anaerolineae bacterium]|nr:twitching motility protein PilT [Anaerolineae bacterium]
MNCACFCFHGEINFFLPHLQRHTTIKHPFDWKASIKDMVESLGVPHCEIELLTVNHVAVDFDYIVLPDVQIDVYAHAIDAPVKAKIALRPPLTGKPSFILDTHLGRLASYLRMMGFDTLYRNDYSDDELALVSNVEQRILLTRDIGLLKRSLVIYGRFVRETNPRQQIIEIMRRYQLLEHVVSFQRCLKCNGELHLVDKDMILHRLTSTTAAYYDVFHQCMDCEQIYWKGSHYDKMQEFMAEVIDHHSLD